MPAWLICPKCGEIYINEKICSTCLVETVASCPFCERSAQECICKYEEIKPMMLQSPYIRKAFVEGIVKGLYKNNFQNIDAVVVYGSLERDMDLLIINNKAQTINTGCFIMGKTILDIIEAPYSLLLSKLKLLDPIYTEPILTGEVCFGDPKLIMELKETAHQIKPTPKVLLYLFNEGLMLLNCAISMIGMYIYERNAAKLEENDIMLDVPFIDEILHMQHAEEKKHRKSKTVETAIVNLAFSCSYLAFCKHYYEGGNLITYKQLLEKENNKLLREIDDYKRKILRGEIYDLDLLTSLISETKGLYKNFEENALPHIVGLLRWVEKDRQ